MVNPNPNRCPQVWVGVNPTLTPTTGPRVELNLNLNTQEGESHTKTRQVPKSKEYIESHMKHLFRQTRRQTPCFLHPQKHAHKGFFHTKGESHTKTLQGLKSEENIVNHTGNVFWDRQEGKSQYFFCGKKKQQMKTNKRTRL